MKTGIKTLDDITDIGLRNIDDIKKFGIRNIDDLKSIGIKNIDDLIKAGVSKPEDLVKLGIKNLDDLGKLGIRNIDDLSRIGIKNADDLARLGIKNADEVFNTIKAASRADIDDTLKQLNTKVDDVELPEGTWKNKPTDRGKDIDDIVGNNLGSNYPVVNKYDEVTGTVTSIKSRDLNAKSYQNGNTLERTIKKDIDSLADYEGASVVRKSDIKVKQLQIVVPNTTLSPKQIEAINNAIQYGKDKGISVIITVGR